MTNDRLIRMLVRMLLRPMMRFILPSGTDTTSREGREQQKQAKEITRKSQQALRVTRRMGRF